jgi:hypothetical protein
MSQGRYHLRHLFKGDLPLLHGRFREYILPVFDEIRTRRG